MIDLDQAARGLTASVAVRPDLPKIQATARRRQQRRRTVVAVAAVAVLVAGGAAALAATTADGRDREQVHAGPNPGTVSSAPVADLVDYGNLRITVPTGWLSVTTDEYPDGTCEADGLILVGPEVVLPSACTEIPTIEVRAGADAAEGPPLETRFSRDNNQLQLVERTDRGEVWSIPSLNSRIVSRNGADPAAVLESVEPSARRAVLTDLIASARLGESTPTSGRKTVSYQGVDLTVPSGWPVSGHHADGDRGDPCLQWQTAGPSAVTGASGNPRCEDGRSWVPRDGVWLLPLGATSVDAGASLNDHFRVDDFDLTVIWDVRLTVLELVVPGVDGGPDVLVRVGLGTDPDTASEIVRSIHRTPDRAIALPCDLTVVPDRRALDLPEDLQVTLRPGMGGTAGAQEGPCAVNLTAVEDPGRHVSFAQGTLPYGLGTGERSIEGDRPVTWGAIEDGFGAQLSAVGSDDALYVVAYGMTEAEAKALFTSLATA